MPSRKQEEVRRLAELIRGIRVAMLTTRDGDDMHSRPMANLDIPFEGTLWFFTNRSAPKVAEVRQDQRVNVTFADAVDDRYVSISGSATMIRDISKNRALWSPAMSAWFPGGPDDRDLALLRIEVDDAEYWDDQSRRMLKVFPGPRPELVREAA